MSELYHVLNRGVDKRIIFLDNQDRFRFVHNLYEFNDKNAASTASYHFTKNGDIERRQIIHQKNRDCLVDIHAFTIMPNHYHIFLSPLAEYAIPLFMKKLNMGYSKYFNEKYERKGTLFEGRYKSITTKNESHFIHLPYYIHANPLDMIEPEWRNGKIKNISKALSFLKNYRWSSHLDYTGEKNFPSVINMKLLLDTFGGTKAYEKSMRDWLTHMNSDDIQDSALE